MSNSVRPQRQQPTRLPCPWDSQGKNTGVGCHFLLQCIKVKNESEVVQSCPTPSDPMDCSLPGSFFHGIFQARVLEWVAIAFSSKLLEGGKIEKTPRRKWLFAINCSNILGGLSPNAKETKNIGRPLFDINHNSIFLDLLPRVMKNKNKQIRPN